MIPNSKLSAVFEKTSDQYHFCGDALVFVKHGGKDINDLEGA